MVAKDRGEWCSWTCWVPERCHLLVNLKASFPCYFQVCIFSPEFLSAIILPQHIALLNFEPYFKVNEPSHMTVTTGSCTSLRSNLAATNFAGTGMVSARVGFARSMNIVSLPEQCYYISRTGHNRTTSNM